MTFFPLFIFLTFWFKDDSLIIILFLVLAIAGVNWLISAIFESVNILNEFLHGIDNPFSLHENFSERGISNSLEGIGNTLYFNDFRVPKTYIFLFNKKVNIARDFSWNMSHRFPTDEVGMHGFFCTRIWVGWKWLGIRFQFHFDFVIQFGIWSWCFLINMIST